MSDTIHSCSPFCTLEACVKQRQRLAFEAWCETFCGGMLTDKDDNAKLARLAAWSAWQSATERATAQQDSKDAVRYRLLKSEAYETVVPHGNTIGGFRTAWITKLHPGADFDAAIDAAIRQGGAT